MQNTHHFINTLIFFHKVWRFYIFWLCHWQVNKMTLPNGTRALNASHCMTAYVRSFGRQPYLPGEISLNWSPCKKGGVRGKMVIGRWFAGFFFWQIGDIKATVFFFKMAVLFYLWTFTEVYHEKNLIGCIETRIM